MEAVQIAAGMMLRGNLRDLHKRMLQEQPGQFAAGIACASHNCHAHRGTMFLLSAHQAASPRAVARTYSATMPGISTPVGSMLLRNSIVALISLTSRPRGLSSTSTARMP